jgi:hypothetical protein
MTFIRCVPSRVTVRLHPVEQYPHVVFTVLPDISLPLCTHLGPVTLDLNATASNASEITDRAKKTAKPAA